MSQYIKRTDALRIVDLHYGHCSGYKEIMRLPAEDVAPVVHGRWIEEHFQSWIPLEYNESDNPVLHDYTCYHCDRCGRIEKKKEPYCNCGARMDGE